MKAKKKMYPGGGMLRNEYAQGGAVYGYGMSRGQGAAALASRPSVKPSQPSMPARATARPSMATATTPPSRVVSVIPAIMAKRAVTTTATPTTAKTTGSSGSFSKAFADARAKGLKEFTWNGKKYTTQIKGGAAAKPQATRNAEPVSKMPMKAVASVTKPYFESPTGVMQPASVKTTEMRGAAVQKMPMKPATSVQASTDKGNQYFKPGTMAEYLEERRRKMQSNLIAKR
jgi:hypothetical protein